MKITEVGAETRAVRRGIGVPLTKVMAQRGDWGTGGATTSQALPRCRDHAVPRSVTSSSSCYLVTVHHYSGAGTDRSDIRQTGRSGTKWRGLVAAYNLLSKLQRQPTGIYDFVETRLKGVLLFAQLHWLRLVQLISLVFNRAHSNAE